MCRILSKSPHKCLIFLMKFILDQILGHLEYWRAQSYFQQLARRLVNARIWHFCLLFNFQSNIDFCIPIDSLSLNLSHNEPTKSLLFFNMYDLIMVCTFSCSRSLSRKLQSDWFPIWHCQKNFCFNKASFSSILLAYKKR